MPQYQAPGVYIEEIELGPPPITGVSTSTAGFIGVAKRGPVNKPTLVTGIGDFERFFGNHLPSSYSDRRWLMYSVQGFFENGGQTCYVVRVSKLPADLSTDVDRSQFGWTARTIIPDRSDAFRQLAAPASSGDAELNLAFTSGLSEGALLLIDDGANAEAVVVTGFVGGAVQVAPPLRLAHPAKTGVMVEAAPSTAAAHLAASTETYPAGIDRVYLADTSNVSDGSWLVIAAEAVKAGAPKPGGWSSVTPKLGATHQAGDAVKIFTQSQTTFNPQADITPPGGPATTISFQFAAGPTIANHEWLVLGVGTNSPEAVQVQGDPTTAAGVTTVTTTVPSQAHVAAQPIAPLIDTGKSTTLAQPAWLALATDPGLAAGAQVVTWESDPTARELLQIGTATPALPSVGGITALVPLAAPPRAAHGTNTEVRALPADSSTPTLTANANAGDQQVTVSDATAFQSDHMLEIRDGRQTEWAWVIGPGSGPNTLALQSGLQFPHRTGTRARSLQNQGSLLVKAGPSRPNPDKWPEVGEWGNEITLQIEAASVAGSTVKTLAAAGSPFVDLVNANGIEPGSQLVLPHNKYATVSKVEGGRVFLDAPLADPLDPGGGPLPVATVEFTLNASYGITSESFPNLSLDPRHSRFVETIVNAQSHLIRVKRIKSGTPTASDLPLLTDTWHPGGGSDPMSHITDPGTIETVFLGEDAANADDRTGIHAFLNVDDVSMIAAPGQTDQVVQEALYAQCENTKYCFAVLDSVKNADIDTVKAQRDFYDSKYAALYYPWIEIFDTLENKPAIAPPSGHVMGIYARTDTEVGVHQAPANQVVTGALDLETMIGKAQQGVLNPKGINAIRAMPGRGIRVWGARTISSDALWRYVNVRRLFIFLEKSIDLSTQYAVFRPNDVPLWNGLRATVTAFLTTVWRSGALQGTTRDQAFFVRVGLGETMTQQDIDEGRVIILVGVAPVKPAEFVVFRIGQKAGGATVTE